jgi:FlaA1/EpsC-like NDP-sugar epimerase
MKILDLAHELIRRHGLEPDQDIAIEFTGVRPGEKLYEELACADEQTRPTSHSKIRVWQLPRATPQHVEQMLQTLSAVVNSSHGEIVSALRQCVAEYQPSTSEGPANLRLVADAA